MGHTPYYSEGLVLVAYLSIHMDCSGVVIAFSTLAFHLSVFFKGESKSGIGNNNKHRNQQILT